MKLGVYLGLIFSLFLFSCSGNSSSEDPAGNRPPLTNPDSFPEVDSSIAKIGKLESSLDGKEAGKISAVKTTELNLITSQVKIIDGKLMAKYDGYKFMASREDLPYLQYLLDKEAIPQADVELLNYLGAAFGEILRKELSLKWIALEDNNGRDLGLKYGNTGFVIFPLNMITKRILRDERVVFEKMYESLENALRDYQLQVSENKP